MITGNTLPMFAQDYSVTVRAYPGVAGGIYHLIDTLPKWKDLYSFLKIKKYLACDTETTGLNHLTSKIVGFSFSWGAENSYYVPVRHTKLTLDPTSDNPKGQNG